MTLDHMKKIGIIKRNMQKYNIVTFMFTNKCFPETSIYSSDNVQIRRRWRWI